MRRTFEHRQWPIHDDDALVNFGNEEIDFLLDHFASLTCMATINTVELKPQWKRVKFEQRHAPFFGMPFKDFWMHLKCHFNGSLGYPDLLVLACVVVLIIADSSCCEQGFSRVNRTLTKERASMSAVTLRDHLNIQMHGPEVGSFDPLPVLQMWLDEPLEGGRQAKGRELAVLIRKISEQNA